MVIWFKTDRRETEPLLLWRLTGTGAKWEGICGLGLSPNLEGLPEGPLGAVGGGPGGGAGRGAIIAVDAEAVAKVGSWFTDTGFSVGSSSLFFNALSLASIIRRLFRPP